MMCCWPGAGINLIFREQKGFGQLLALCLDFPPDCLTFLPHIMSRFFTLNYVLICLPDVMSVFLPGSMSGAQKVKSS